MPQSRYRLFFITRKRQESKVKHSQVPHPRDSNAIMSSCTHIIHSLVAGLTSRRRTCRLFGIKDLASAEQQSSNVQISRTQPKGGAVPERSEPVVCCLSPQWSQCLHTCPIYKPDCADNSRATWRDPGRYCETTKAVAWPALSILACFPSLGRLRCLHRKM